MDRLQQHRSTICNIEDADIENAEDPGYPAPSPPPVPSSPSMPWTHNPFTPLSVTPETPSPTPSGSSGLEDALEHFMKATSASVSMLTVTAAGRIETRVPLFQRHLSLLGQEVVEANVPTAVQHSLLRDIQELIYKAIEPYQ